eukprot:2285851-Pyramimonas_sp.AAC.1
MPKRSEANAGVVSAPLGSPPVPIRVWRGGRGLKNVIRKRAHVITTTLWVTRQCSQFVHAAVLFLHVQWQHDNCSPDEG